jgi:hypothetical protein
MLVALVDATDQRRSVLRTSSIARSPGNLRAVLVPRHGISNKCTIVHISPVIRTTFQLHVNSSSLGLSESPCSTYELLLQTNSTKELLLQRWCGSLRQPLQLVTTNSEEGLPLQDDVRGINIQSPDNPFFLFRRNGLAAQKLFKRRDAMHSISTVLKTVRSLVHGVSIGVKARSQSTFPPVHTRRISDEMHRRKVPQVPKWISKKEDGSSAGVDTPRQTRQACRTYFQVLSLTLYLLATIGWLVSLSRSPVLS